ncbi:insulin-like growth factor 1 [Polymixia lowei]
MHSSESSQHGPSVRGQTLKVLCVLYSTICLASLLIPADAARLRCGSDLLADLIFVCGDRGIYLGKGNWSGYGSRPRGKGIVDHCCRPAGCDLHHLEMYCAKPKSSSLHTTVYPTTPQASSPPLVTGQQFQAVFHKKLLEHLGTPNSPKRDTYRKKKHNSLRRKSSSSSHRRIHVQQPTSRPPPGSHNPLKGGTTLS